MVALNIVTLIYPSYSGSCNADYTCLFLLLWLSKGPGDVLDIAYNNLKFKQTE